VVPTDAFVNKYSNGSWFLDNDSTGLSQDFDVNFQFSGSESITLPCSNSNFKILKLHLARAD
jgi:hypothetical protein